MRCKYNYPYKIGHYPILVEDILRFCAYESYFDYLKEIRRLLYEQRTVLPIVIGDRVLDIGTQSANVLIGGVTGSGKTNLLYNIILNLLVNTHSTYCNIHLLDPTKNSFLKFQKHIQVVRGNEAITTFFQGLKIKVDSKYERLGVYENIVDYNLYSGELMPFDIVVFDEFASYQCEDVKGYIAQLVATSRAVGVYFIFATQRPCVEVINGVIRANFVVRVCLPVVDAVNEKIVLGCEGLGATKLKLGEAILAYGLDIEKVTIPYLKPQKLRKILKNIA